MSLLIKLKDRQTGQPVIADDDDNEFLNIINLLAGQDVGKSIRIVNSDPAFAAARFDQNAASGNIAEFFKQGVSKANFDSAGNLFIVHNITPGVVLKDTAAANHLSIVTTPSNIAQIGNTIGGAQIATIDLATGVITFVQQPVLPNQKTAFSVSPWFYSVQPGAVETIESVGRWIVPAGTEIQIIDIVAVWAAGSDSGASNIFTIKHRNAAGVLQADVGTIDINTPAKDVVQVTTLGAPLTLTAGDQLYPLKTTHNTGSEQLVGIGIRGKQKFTS